MSSKIEQLKAVKRLQQQSVQEKAMYPEGIPGESEGSEERANVSSNQPSKERSSGSVLRRRFSFDLRPELHKELKMIALMEERNMYEIIEDLIEGYISERKN